MYFFLFTKGLLHAKLDHLYAICGVENSPVFQSYTVSPCKQNIFKMKDVKIQISMRFKLKNNMVTRLYYALVLKFHVWKPLLEGLNILFDIDIQCRVQGNHAES